MADPMSVAYDAGLEFGQRLCAEIQSERDKLREALEWIWVEVLAGGMDDLDFQNTLEELGLLVEVPADEQFREDWDADTMYVLAWQAKADDA